MTFRRSDHFPAWVAEDVRPWLAAIVDSSDDAIISKNLDGVILTWNSAAERLFGYSEEEVLTARIARIMFPSTLKPGLSRLPNPSTFCQPSILLPRRG